MLSNVSDALDGLTQPVTLKAVAKICADFVESVSVTTESYPTVVQPTKKTQLNADTLDWSRGHITLHGYTRLEFGQVVEWKGRDYKIVEVADWSDYGYYEAVCEETKLPVLEVTP